jgi:hypothetical protein
MDNLAALEPWVGCMAAMGTRNLSNAGHVDSARIAAGGQEGDHHDEPHFTAPAPMASRRRRPHLRPARHRLRWRDGHLEYHGAGHLHHCPGHHDHHRGSRHHDHHHDYRGRDHHHPSGELIDLFWREGDVLGVVGVAHDDVLSVWKGPGVSYDIVATLDPLADHVVTTGRVA